MSVHPAVRVRICAPAAEGRRLAARLTRGGIVAALDDGGDAEVLVTVGMLPELRDMDRFGDALRIAAEIPGTDFSSAVAAAADRVQGVHAGAMR